MGEKDWLRRELGVFVGVDVPAPDADAVPVGDPDRVPVVVRVGVPEALRDELREEENV